MAGGDGGWNPGQDISNAWEDFKSDPVGTITNASLNYMSGGLVGYKDGKLAPGITARAGIQGLGDISGTNALAKKMEQDVKDAKAAQDRQRQTELQRQEAQERQGSQAILARNQRLQAGGAVATGTAGADGGLGLPDTSTANTQYLGI